jgi:hypothetical protein
VSAAPVIDGRNATEVETRPEPLALPDPTPAGRPLGQRVDGVTPA